ncbi:MAG: phosphatase domain-containing protein [Paracoccaceae bacterium]
MLATLHRFALAVERVVDRLRPRRRADPVIDPYLGYATPGALIARGRVLSALRRTSPEPGGGRLATFAQMVGLFLTAEVGGARVVASRVDAGRDAIDGGRAIAAADDGHAASGAAGSAAAGSEEGAVATGDGEGAVASNGEEGAATSDEEGYVTLRLPRPEGVVGWVGVDARVEGAPASETRLRVLVPEPRAPAMAISDIDDTVMRTGAWSLALNLWTSLTSSAQEREIYADAAATLTRLAEAGCPIYYVSSSPWNLRAFLAQVFERAGVPEGPMFLRDFGLSEGKFVTEGHGSHKGEAIDLLMAANPDLPVLLFGDVGQEDPAVYADAVERWPGRVRAVVLREPRPGLADDDRPALARLRASGVAVHVTEDFAAVAGLLA